MKFAALLPLLLLATAPVLAQSTKTTQGTAGPAGSGVVTQTSSVPLTKAGPATISGYSSTTVTGGSRLDGSGNVIPTESRGSSASSSVGVSVSIPLPEKNDGN